MNKLLIKNIRRNADGTINAEATRTAYDAALLSSLAESLATAETKLKKEYTEALDAYQEDFNVYASERGTWDLMSKIYIDRVFDRYKGSVKGGCITKPTLISMCVTSMVAEGDCHFTQMKHVSEMIAAFISDNNGTLYTVEKGKDGGVRRINKHPDAEIQA